MPASRDHYDVLGVARSASPDEIRSAHRRLARQYHPDLNKESGAAERFNEIQRAYEILSDPEKRKKYDQFGDAAFDAGAASAGHPGSGAAWQEMDPEAMRDIFGDIFGDGFGGGAGGGRRRGRGRAPRPTQGPDREFELAIGFAVAANGGTEQLRMRAADGSSETIDVKIPAGVADGSKLRVRGRGEAGFDGGPRGDLILTVRVGAHPWFTRDGLDLSVDVPITIAEAALGAMVEVPLLKGRVKLKVPPGTSSGAKLRVRGKGVTDAKGVSGDLYAVIAIAAPKDVSAEDRGMLESLATRLADPRSSLAWAE
jgi:curved DNA-binding protein